MHSSEHKFRTSCLTQGEKGKYQSVLAKMTTAINRMNMEQNLELQPGQILCLENDNQNLYVELIQLASSDRTEHNTRGNSCWVRPLLLVDSSYEPPIIEDLRNASDLLWQLDSFRVALDTEVIAYFHQVLIKEADPDSAPLARQRLNRFVQQIWHSQTNS